MRIERVVLAALAVLSVSAVALAQEPPAPPAGAPSAEASAAPAASAEHAAPAPSASATAEAAPADKAKGSEEHKASDEPDSKDRRPLKYEVGVNVQKLTKLELGPGTFEADFLVAYHCAAEPCDPHLELYNGEIKGKPDKVVDDPLHKVYRVKAELSANIDVSRFPLDEHELVIDLGDQDEDVTFTANAKDAPDPTDVVLAGWDIKSGHAEVTAEDLGDGLKASHYTYATTVGRPTFAAIAKNFLPALTMVFVLLVSLFMRPKMAAPRLAAGTGSFVAVIMFHNTAAAQLPPLGFFTLLDKFMFSLYLVWLAHIVFSVLIIRAEDQKNEKRSDSLYRIALVAVPVLCVVGWGLVFGKVV